MMQDLKKIYHRRFREDMSLRNRIYRVLCNDFFQKYIPRSALIIELGAGYCEFINNIDAKKKIAIDINPDVHKYAENDVEVILSTSINIKQINNETADIVFTNNFFEHLDKNDIVKTIKEIYRVLKKDGKILILQPNIRFCYKDYWMFFDHITPLDDRSMTEILEVNGFNIIECKPKFLPYTIKTKFPKSIFLLKLYLKIPIIQKIMGKQFFIYAKKI